MFTKKSTAISVEHVTQSPLQTLTLRAPPKAPQATMAANTEQDAFGRLPEELRIKIIKLSPDPWSLRNLAHASPAMGRVLDRYPLEILEVVLEVVPVQTRRLMSAVLEARFSRFPASLSEAQNVAKTDSTATTNETRSPRLDEAAAAVRSLLATAENVHAWSHACLEQLIRKSMELRPSPCAPTYPNRASQEESEKRKAENRDYYLPQYTGPPSWVEEQRMIKAFWRIQFFLELQGTSDKGRLSTHWPGQEVDLLSKSSPDSFFDVSNFDREQILTACDFFGAVTSRTTTPAEAVHDNAYGLPTIRQIVKATPRCVCAEPLFFEINKDIFRQRPECVDLTSRSYNFLDIMSKPHPEGISPLYGFPFQSCSKYGFAIWDDKRMADLGMVDPTAKSILKNYGFYCCRWRSLLTEEERRQCM
ncbi:hypothetical protein N0V95_009431 [Ascochyta clinopodiicola]|nr:hypothetical protein N0V95_009431 [Ascochyta clinopodiicola]